MCTWPVPSTLRTAHSFVVVTARVLHDDCLLVTLSASMGQSFLLGILVLTTFAAFLSFATRFINLVARRQASKSRRALPLHPLDIVANVLHLLSLSFVAMAYHFRRASGIWLRVHQTALECSLHFSSFLNVLQNKMSQRSCQQCTDSNNCRSPWLGRSLEALVAENLFIHVVSQYARQCRFHLHY